MNTTNKDIIEEFIKNTPAWAENFKHYYHSNSKDGGCIMCGIRPEEMLKLCEALIAKDNKHREETREILEGIPLPMPSDDIAVDPLLSIDKKLKAYQQLIKDRYNLNSPR